MAIKFVYFDLRARGEPVRLVLTAAGQQFEDVRISFDQWPAEKPNTPYGQLPYLVYNGKTYGQSVAIARFFAREFGLFGKNNLEGLRVDEVVHLGVDLQDSLYKAKFENDEAKKAELKKKLDEEIIPKTLGFYQRLLQENGSNGFFAGDSVTLADLFTYNVLDALTMENSDVVSKFPPEIKKLQSNVEAQPNLKDYLASRKPVQF